MPIEAVLALGYALLLAGAAAALEWIARRVHRRSQDFQTAGFIYDPELDLWRCPTGQTLHRRGADAPHRRVLYGAPADACNRCHAKASCTDSDTGRTLEIKPGAWVDSTMARFHRGLSLALLLLAELILALECYRIGETRPAAWLLAAVLLILGAVALRLARQFFAPPDTFS